MNILYIYDDTGEIRKSLETLNSVDYNLQHVYINNMEHAYEECSMLITRVEHAQYFLDHDVLNKPLLILTSEFSDNLAFERAIEYGCQEFLVLPFSDKEYNNLMTKIKSSFPEYIV